MPTATSRDLEMRYVCFVVSLIVFVPSTAAAQHSFSLPSIGLPLPPIGLSPSSPWEHPRTPVWEKPRSPSWETPRQSTWPRPDGRTWEDAQSRPHRRSGQKHVPGYVYPGILYYGAPYVIEVPQPPQVIVIERPVETRVVEVEVPAREPDPPPAPYVPSGDRTVYMIPGCYVGNVAPDKVTLPHGCDRSKLITYTP
jgi:hypothetical protein